MPTEVRKSPSARLKGSASYCKCWYIRKLTALGPAKSTIAKEQPSIFQKIDHPTRDILSTFDCLPLQSAPWTGDACYPLAHRPLPSCDTVQSTTKSGSSPSLR
jgi:hypothetical protein